MQTFFVEIKCKLGKTYQVASVLADREISSEIYSTAGNYDILAKFHVDDGVVSNIAVRGEAVRLGPVDPDQFDARRRCPGSTARDTGHVMPAGLRVGRDRLGQEFGATEHE